MAGRPGGSQDFRCFCLPASGAIAVKQDFFHSNGSISINSSAGKNGGALLLSSSWGRDNLAVACGGSTGSQKRSFERPCVDISGRVLLAYCTLCHMAFVLILLRSMMFSSISSP